MFATLFILSELIRGIGYLFARKKVSEKPEAKGSSQAKEDDGQEERDVAIISALMRQRNQQGNIKIVRANK